MARFGFLRRTLDFLLDSHDAIQREYAKPHGARVREGLRAGARSAASGVGAGLAGYAISKYLFGADEQTANMIALYAGAFGAMAGGYQSYVRTAPDQESRQSLLNILAPAREYVRYCRSYR